MKKLLYILFCIIGFFISCQKDKNDLPKSLNSSIGNNEEPRSLFKAYGDTSEVDFFRNYKYLLGYDSNPLLSRPKTYLWYPSNETTSTIIIDKPGLYSVKVTSQFNGRDSVNRYYINLKLLENPSGVIYISNSILLNTHAQDRKWQPKSFDVEGYELKIKDKDGKIVFKTNDFAEYWNGDDGLEKASTIDSYNYFIRVKFFNNDKIFSYKGVIRAID